VHKKNNIILKNVAILTSKRSWFVPYAKEFVKNLKEKGHQSELFYKHENIRKDYQIVFVLSYFNIINERFLKEHKHNLVIHESLLPQGKGWAPLFWQILEGRNKIPIVLFEATPEVDAGDIYIKDYIRLEGHELHDEIRRLQAQKSIEMCLYFLENYENLKPINQSGKETYYARRTPKDSELEIDKSIREQFNLLRIVKNDEFPAFFLHQGSKYVIKIFKEENCK